MTRPFGSPLQLILWATLASLTTGCTQLNLQAGLSDFSAESDDVFDETTSISGGVGLESNLNRRWSIEGAFFWDGELVDGLANGQDATVEQYSGEINVDFNLARDQRDADHFFLPVDSMDSEYEEDDTPWILSPLKWWEEALPSLVPFIRGGVVWANHNVDVAGEEDDFDDVYVKYGGGVKWNVSPNDQLRFGADVISLRSNESGPVEGSLLRYYVGYSIAF